jgi:preprotein translocase subunit SecB
MPSIKMYTTAVCPYCIRAKQILASRGVSQIDEIRVDLDPAQRMQMMEITGRRTVPQIFIGDTHVGGCDELMALDRQGELASAAGRPPETPSRAEIIPVLPAGAACRSQLSSSSESTPTETSWPTRRTHVFNIQRVYLKEASLEQPNSPGHPARAGAAVAVDIQLGVDATPVADGVFEVAVTATVQTKIKDRTVFLVEVKQAGIFEIRNLPDEQMGPVMGIACPQIVYPYLRGNVADLITARRLPACAPGGDQLPGHVRAAAGPGDGRSAPHRHFLIKSGCSPRQC